MALWTRGIRPPDAEVPNTNPPQPPGTVGPPDATPGDPQGVEVTGESSDWVPPRIVPSAWSGWPGDWATPYWGGRLTNLTDTAWMCLDRNSSALATMPPYLVGAAPSLSADWLQNPDPDLYVSWEEFADRLFTDYQLGEAYVLATAYYSTGWPARFHVVPPWMVEPQLSNGLRRFLIGGIDETDNILAIFYKSSLDNAHGVGPLDVGSSRMVAAQMLSQYGAKIATTGVPSGVLAFPNGINAAQAADAKAQWLNARLSSIGEPAVLSGGITWTPTQLNPEEMALLDLLKFNESRIASLLGIPPELVGLPSDSGTMTYKNWTSLLDYHWRSGLRPKAQKVMSALSGWALPRGTKVELNRDAYVQPEPLVRAQTAQILAGIVDPQTGQPALSVAEIRAAERLDDAIPSNVAQGVLRG